MKRYLSSPSVCRVKVGCSPYQAGLWESAFLILVSELLGKSCPIGESHPYPDATCCLWLLAQEGPKDGEAPSLIKPQHFPLRLPPKLEELASPVE